MRNVITLSLVVRRRTIKVQVHCAADGIKTTRGKVMTKKKTNETKRNETKTEDKTRILREGLFFPRRRIPLSQEG